MNIVSASMSRHEAKAFIEESRDIRFNTSFDFLRTHNGWRPEKIHVILGATGAGKSTFVRSLLIDIEEFSKNQSKVGLWLTEETTDDFKREMAFSTYDLQNTFLFSEQDNSFSSAKEWYLSLESFITQSNCEILFLDNITTSYGYMDRKVSEQALISKALKNLAQKYNIPIVLIAHTGADVGENYPRMITANNIRGSKTLVNLAEFFYILQVFNVENHRHLFLKIEKHRGYVVKSKLFKLLFHEKTKIFAKSEKKDFEEFKEIFKQRNILGRD